MTSPRAFASLSSALLARKGGARPAMRSQLDPSGEPVRHDPLSDLGWNDMGGDPALSVPAEPMLGVVVFEPAVSPLPSAARPSSPTAAPVPAAAPAAAPAAPILASKPAPAEVVPLVRDPLVTAPARPASLSQIGARSIVRRSRPAAFTLRLDPDRHYRLRVACLLQARSAQALVTEAVDRMLDQQPETELLSALGGAQRIA